MATHPNDQLTPEKQLSWQAKILPFLEQSALHDRLNFEESWESGINKMMAQNQVPVFLNPGLTETEGEDGVKVTHYVGVAGIGKDAPALPVTSERAGIFGIDRKTRFRDVTDGMSNTMMITEASDNFGPWIAGGQPTIRALTEKPYVNGPDGIGGPFSGGFNACLADGSVHFISEDIDPEVLEALATMAGGELVRDF